MSSLTRCNVKGSGARAIRATTLLRMAVVFAAVLGFGLGHLYLRFNLNQTKRDTKALQAQKDTLLSEINELKSKNASQVVSAELLKSAREELHMVDSPALGPESKIRIPRETTLRYAMARAAHPAAIGDASGSVVAAGVKPASNAEWLQAMGERVGIVGDAQARDTK